MSCDLCGDPIVLDDRSSLQLRHLGRQDAVALAALYDELSANDLRVRFFSGAHPPAAFFETWAAIEEEGGLVLGVELSEPDGVRLVGEAGYALLSDGDGELGITVRRDFRGWLGPWLLDVLLDHAAARGVPNLQALVLAENRSMMALARRRTAAVLDHPDWGAVRLTMSTSGPVPSWPSRRGRPRVLVESQRSRWPPETKLREDGIDVAICSGPCRGLDRCPVLAGEPCPLIDGADAVVVDLPAGDALTETLLNAERVVHPGVALISGYATDADGKQRRRTEAEIRAALDAVLQAGQDPSSTDSGRQEP